MNARVMPKCSQNPLQSAPAAGIRILGNRVVYPAACFARIHESCVPKYREVLGNGRWSQLQELDNLAHTELTTPQREQRPDAALVRERVGYRQQFTHDILSFSSLTKYYYFRGDAQAVFCRHKGKAVLLGCTQVSTREEDFLLGTCVSEAHNNQTRFLGKKPNKCSRVPIPGVRKEMRDESDNSTMTDEECSSKQKPSRGLPALVSWIRRARYSRRGFENQRYLGKWLLISGSIGVVAGLGAVAFYSSIDLCTHLFLGRIVGYLPPSPLGEGAPTVAPMARPWLLPLVTALGGLLSGIIVFKLAPEAEGHGTDSAIDAIHHKQGLVRARIPPIKLIASAITIGSGGSGGREGPAAQISAGFGSLMGKWLGLEVQNRRIAVAAGIGAGIGAIFRAPLGGAVLAAEILYIHDLEIEALIPALIASIVGYSVFCSFYGFSPIFGGQSGLSFNNPIQLVYFAVLGVACGVFGILYSRTFYGVAAFSHRLRLPAWLKPAIGGFLVGLMGLVLPGSLHMGYGWVQIAMGKEILGLPLWVILALPAAKIVSTSLSIGSGGSGGIFGPGMVIGGMLGASFWRLFHALLPGMPAEPASFVIIGMIAMFGGIAHAPLAVMLMVAEMTGNLSLLAPAMVAVAVSSALVGNNTIYSSQLPTRADSPAHRVRFSFPLLSTLLVRDAMRARLPAVRQDSSLAEVETSLASESSSGVVIVDPDDRPVGIISRQNMARLSAAERSKNEINRILECRDLRLTADQHLDVALERLAMEGASWAPVVEDGRYVGVLTVKDVARTYRESLEKGVRRAEALPGDVTLFEARLGATSAIAAHSLKEANLPKGTLVISITRNGETMFPRADARLEVGDKVLILADPAVESELRSFLEG